MYARARTRDKATYLLGQSKVLPLIPKSGSGAASGLDLIKSLRLSAKAAFSSASSPSSPPRVAAPASLTPPPRLDQSVWGCTLRPAPGITRNAGLPSSLEISCADSVCSRSRAAPSASRRSIYEDRMWRFFMQDLSVFVPEGLRYI